MVRTNQGGSVLSFVIIGIVLTGLFVGGVIIFHNQISSNNDVTSQPTASNPSSPPSSTPVPSTSNGSSSSQQGQNTSPVSPSESVSTGAELPHTGPSEVVEAMAAILLLTASGVAYLRSRRPELSL